MAEEDEETASVRSVSFVEQIIFWSLLLSFMAKMIGAILCGVSMFNNNWQSLYDEEDKTYLVRGISGSDCVWKESDSKINCIRWTERDSDPTHFRLFWAEHGVVDVIVKQPTEWILSAFYICFFLIFLYLLDLTSILVLCCRKKDKPEQIRRPSQISLLCSAFVGKSEHNNEIFSALTYCVVIWGILCRGGEDFVERKSQLERSIGSGMRIFIWSFVAYLLGVFVQQIYRVQLVIGKCVDWGCFMIRSHSEYQRGRREQADREEAERMEAESAI